MDRRALYEAVWLRPSTDVAAELGITSTGLKKICDRHQIPTPRRGYWAQVRVGKVFKRPPLRPTKNKALEEIYIVGARAVPPAVAAAIDRARAFSATNRARSSATSGIDEVPHAGAVESGLTGTSTSPPPSRKDLERTERAISRARVSEAGFGSASGAGIVSITASPNIQQEALSFLVQFLNAAELRG